MSKGENIYKRKDGRWEARYIKDHTPEGRIHYGYCYGKTYKEAKEKVLKCKSALLEGKAIAQRESRQIFTSYCDEWLNASRSRIKESTYVKYTGIIKNHIKPYFGDYRPASITTETLETYRKDLLEKKRLSAKTIKDVLVVLHSILHYVAKNSINSYHPPEIIYPKETRKEMQTLSLNEQQRFITYLTTDMDPCKFGIYLAMHTGMRIGEVCALQWKHISLTDQTIHVTATLQRLSDLYLSAEQPRTKIVIDAPKSRNSIRVIPMTDSIERICQKMKVQNMEAYILTATDRYMEPRTLQYRLRRYTKDCHLENVHFHMLRHTFATRCIEAGFEVKSLSEILGHSNTAITMDRYVHASIHWKRENMKKLDTLIVKV